MEDKLVEKISITLWQKKIIDLWITYILSPIFWNFFIFGDGVVEHFDITISYNKYKKKTYISEISSIIVILSLLQSQLYLYSFPILISIYK
jgi:hypothetical protein